MSTPSRQPKEEEIDELLLSCRYGDQEDVQSFLENFGVQAVAQARDDRGNNVLHMCCGNGHADLLNYLLPLLPTSLISQTNQSKSPPLHWAILNSHINCVKILVNLPESSGGGLPLLQVRNGSNRDAFEESLWAGEGREEVSGFIEGFLARSEGEPGGLEDEKDERDIRMSMKEGSGGKMEIERVDPTTGVDEVVEKTEGLKM